MGADLFESYVGAIVSAFTLGFIAHGQKGILFVAALAAVGVLASIIGTLFVRGDSNPQKALNLGNVVGSIITVIASYFLSMNIIGEIKPFIATVAGLCVGLIIAKIT